MKTMKKYFVCIMLFMTITFQNKSAQADLFGGDVAVLIQILAQSIEQVYRLQSIIQNGKDTLNLLRDINAGVRSGLDLIRIVNPKFNAGVYGDLNNPENVLRAIHDLYGTTPNTADKNLIDMQDQSVAEVIAMNKNLYDYSTQVDFERERILMHSQVVSPQGAAKLQNQSLAVIIGVLTQLLRVQSQMLKVMGQNMALDNRREKLASEQFIENYKSLSDGFKDLPKDIKLPSLQGGSK
jgi:hypothetical protein